MHLIYTTYLGGSGYDSCSALDVASDGSTSLAGFTNSANFPTINAVQITLKGVYSAFVAHLDNSGSQLIFSTYLGGTSGADASGLALGPDKSVYVTGKTSSLDFPVTKGAIKLICEADPNLNSCDGDAFVTRLSPDGQLIYSTLLGGSNVDSATGIAVDTQGQAYIAGTTSSDDFPLKRAAQPQRKGSTSAFLSRVSADGTQLIFSTYFGGSGSLQTTGMAIDQRRNIYLTGYLVLDELQRLPPPELPLLNPFQPHSGGGLIDGFVVKFDPKGRPVYSSYLGGSSNDIPNQVVVDAEGQAVVVGWTSSLDFPTLNALQAGLNANAHAFVTKIAVSGSSLIYSTYLGGSGGEAASSVTNDGASGVWVVGDTYSTDFPLLSPFQPAYGGGYQDGFLTHIAPSANDSAAATCSACETPRAR